MNFFPITGARFLFTIAFFLFTVCSGANHDLAENVGFRTFLLANDEPETSTPLSSEDSIAIAGTINDVLIKFLKPEQFRVISLSTATDENGKAFTGNMKLFNQDVRLSGQSFNEGGAKNFRIEFPGGVQLQASSLDQLTGTSLSNIFPVEVNVLSSTRTSLSHFSFEMDDSKSWSQFKMGFSSTDWDLLSFNTARLNDVIVELVVDYPTDQGRRKLGGIINGNFNVEGHSVTISASISSRKEDLEFTGVIPSASLKGFSEWIGGIGGSTQLNMLIPASIQNLGMQDVQASVRPFAKSATASAGTDLGKIAFDVEVEGNTDVQFALSTNQSFSFASIDESLRSLDELKMNDLLMVVATRQGPSRIWTDGALVDVTELQRGVNFKGGMKVPGKVRDVIKVDEVSMVGFFKSSGSFAMHANINFEDAVIADGARMSNIRFGIAMSQGKPSLILGGRMDVDISSSEMLGLNGEFKLNMAGVEGVGAFWLEAMHQNGMQSSTGSAAEPAIWKEPFGIPGVSVRKLGVSVGVSPASPILLSSLGFTGDMKLGLAQDNAKHIGGKLAMNVSITDVSGSIVDLNVARMNLKSFIEAFADLEVSGVLAEVTKSIGTENTQILIVPRDGLQFMGQTYERGIKLQQDFELMGLDVKMAFGIDPDGKELEGKGEIESFVIESGGFEFFKLSGGKDPVTQQPLPKPQISLDMSGSPKFLINGEVTVLETMSMTGFIEIGSDGFVANVSGDIAGILAAEVTVQVKEFSDGGIRIAGKLENRLMDELERYVENYTKQRTQDAQNKISKLEQEMKSGNPASMIAAQFNAAFDMVKGLPNDMGAAGAYLLRNSVGELIDLQSISFDFTLTDKNTKVQAGITARILGKQINENMTLDLQTANMEAFMKQVAEELGQTILRALEEAGKAIYEGVIKAAESAARALGEAIIEVGNEVAEWGAYNFTCDDVVAPRNGRSLFAKEGTYHFSITARDFTVVEASDNGGLDSDLEIYGAIFMTINGQLGAHVDPMSNQFFFNRSCENSSQVQRNQGESFVMNASKHLYFSANSVKGKTLGLNCQLRDADGLTGNAESDPIHGSHTINLDNYPPDGMVKTFEVNCGSGGQKVKVRFDVRCEIVEHNIAMGKPCSMSSQDGGRDARKALDSNTDGRMDQQSIAATSNQTNPWWQVDLKLVHTLEEVIIHKENGMSMDNAWVVWGTDPNFGGFSSPLELPAANRIQVGNMGSSKKITLSGNNEGQYVRIWLNGQGQLKLAEVLVDGIVSRNMLKQAIAQQNHQDFWVYERHLTPTERTQFLADVVEGNSYQWTLDLCMGGATPTTEHLALAVQNTVKAYAPGITQTSLPSWGISRLLMSYGAKCTDELFDKMWTYKDKESALYALETGYIPGPAIVEKYITQGYDVGIRMLKAGAPITEQAILNATKSSPNTILYMVNEKGIVPSDSAFAVALETGNRSVLDAFCQRKQPNDNHLVYAARKNDRGMYELFIKYGARPVSIASAEWAEKNRNRELLTTALRNGLDADAVMRLMVERKNIDYIKFVAMEGGNPDLALDFAGSLMQSDLLLILIEVYNATPNKALLAASNGRRTKEIQACLERGADPRPIVKKHADQGDEEIVRMLIEYGGNPSEAIYGAAATNKPNLVTFLVQNGADVSNPELVKRAVENASVSMIKDLLGAGADPNPAAAYVFKYHLEPGSARRQIASLCLQFGADPNGLMKVPAEDGYTDVVIELLNYGANANDGLPYAAKGGHYELTKYLLDYGADAEPGMEPAVKSGNAKLVQLIIDRGGDGAKDQYVFIASANLFAEMIPILVKAGGNVNAFDGKRYPIHLAADEKEGSLPTLQELIKAGANINAKDEDGDTPLHYCVRNRKKSLEAAQFLIESGADIRAVNNKGKDIQKVARGPKMNKLIKEALKE